MTSKNFIQISQRKEKKKDLLDMWMILKLGEMSVLIVCLK